VRDGETGLKASDGAAAWGQALTRLADGADERDAIAERAFREVTSSRLLRHGSGDLVQLVTLSMGG
jgi:hypothetical protein